MGVDEAGHADHAGRVEDGKPGRVDVLGHGDDGAVSHVHVAAREIADLGIDGQHGGAADDELAAGRQRPAGPRGEARLRAKQAGRCSGCRERGRRSENRSSIDSSLDHAAPPRGKREVSEKRAWSAKNA